MELEDIKDSMRQHRDMLNRLKERRQRIERLYKQDVEQVERAIRYEENILSQLAELPAKQAENEIKVNGQ